MALCSFGPAIDVLVGGSDLTFPHHAYQTLMVEAAAAVRPFAQATMHIGEVRVDGAKMAKSTGNLVLVSSLLERFDPAPCGWRLLRPWSQPWDCTDEVFTRADRRARRPAPRGGGDRAPGPVGRRARPRCVGAGRHRGREPRARRRPGRATPPNLLDVLRLTPPS